MKNSAKIRSLIINDINIECQYLPLNKLFGLGLHDGQIALKPD